MTEQCLTEELPAYEIQILFEFLRATAALPQRLGDVGRQIRSGHPAVFGLAQILQFVTPRMFQEVAEVEGRIGLRQELVEQIIVGQGDQTLDLVVDERRLGSSAWGKGPRRRSSNSRAPRIWFTAGTLGSVPNLRKSRMAPRSDQPGCVL